MLFNFLVGYKGYTQEEALLPPLVTHATAIVGAASPDLLTHSSR